MKFSSTYFQHSEITKDILNKLTFSIYKFIIKKINYFFKIQKNKKNQKKNLLKNQLQKNLKEDHLKIQKN